MPPQAVKQFLDLLHETPMLLEEVKNFNYKQNCFKCGLCVSLADRNNLAITTGEMDAARRQFIAGELVLEGIRYAPNPDRIAALKRAFGQRLNFMRLVPPPLQLNHRST
jgi:hypothetical protein